MAIRPNSVMNAVVVVAALAVSCCLALPSSSAAPSAGPRDARESAAGQPAGQLIATSAWPIPLTQYNICENSCPGTILRSVQYVTFFDAQIQSWSYSFNEICISTAISLATNLGVGVATEVTWTHASRCSGGLFGNAILFRGGYSSSYRFAYTVPGNGNCTTTECRAALCVSTSTIDGHLVSCTTHLGTGGLQQTKDQAEQYAWVSTAYGNANGNYFWDAGDFNLNPYYVPSVFWDNFWRANTGNTFNAYAVGGPSIQIDYLWTHSFNFAPVNSSPFCPTDASDHCLVGGTYTPF